jgi:hypothetical protein
MIRHPASNRESGGFFYIFMPVGIAMLVFTAVLVFVFVVIALKHERKPVANGDVVIVSAQCLEMAARTEALRQSFEKLDTGDPEALMTKEQTDIAASLLRARSTWVGECAAGQESEQWYGILESRYETTLAQPQMDESLKAESVGRAALMDGDYKLALQYLSTALSLQRQVNDQYPTSKNASMNRVQKLERQVEQATFKPLVQGYQTERSAADALYENGDYVAARDKYLSLIRTLKSLSFKVPQSYLDADDKARLLEQRVMEIGAQLRGKQVEALVAQAEQAAAGGDFVNAQELFSKALGVQRTIDTDYPHSSLSGAEHMEALDLRRQNVLSRQLTAHLARSLDRLAACLKAEDDRQVQDAVVDAQTTLSELARKFPKADALRSENFKRISFLFSIRQDVCMLRQAVVEHLRPASGKDGWTMLDREVSQLIFSRINGSNPSVRKAENLPVEGVTLDEARTFARRLSWIIGADVRLPDLVHYMASLKPVEGGWARKGTWNSSTAAGRELQPVASSTPDARGYYDLLGNVSEWVEPDNSDAASAIVIGGSVRDNPIRISEIPQETHDVAERVRNNGFRVMVKLGE